VRHDLLDIFVIVICAIICGAEGWEDMEEYGEAQAEWLKQFFSLPHGIPSDDTFRRVLTRLDPEELRACFLSWTRALSERYPCEIVAIDGKTLRHSFDHAASQAAIHMVSAWATANRLVLGQDKVDDKSNEITAIPKLLRLVALDGCIVTIDAMGCQKESVRAITEQGADDVLALITIRASMRTSRSLYRMSKRPAGIRLLIKPTKPLMGIMAAWRPGRLGAPRLRKDVNPRHAR
jgi:predicted transposase YbfD/YdcC